MPELKNNRFINACFRESVDRTPVWMMRQAGRYLPEYLESRKKAPNFMDFCKQPELCCEVTMQPLDRFPLDASIIFSDILTIPDAMGMDLNFIQGVGPVFNDPIRSSADLNKLDLNNTTEKCQYVYDAINLVKKELDNKLPLIGFAGSPWTLATYMVEGQGTKTFDVIRQMLYRDPDLLSQILQAITDSLVDYLNAQIAAGVDAIMIFDSWGGVLSPFTYESFSLKYMREIISKLNREVDGKKIPVIMFTKGGGLWLENQVTSGADVLGLDWTIDIVEAKRRVGNKAALQGNLDPAFLFAKPTAIKQEVKRILSAYNGAPGHIFNLGHGIHKDTPIEGVEAMFAALGE